MRLEFKGTYLTHDKVTKVIYMILCTKCKRKYTRETDNLKEELIIVNRRVIQLFKN